MMDEQTKRQSNRAAWRIVGAVTLFAIGWTVFGRSPAIGWFLIVVGAVMALLAWQGSRNIR